ncbi:adhesion G-protein coupled receptor G4 [Phyllopteryx taeniolatus]|uniref:adhesion G-protein coupled receptor G4 n=1 Tax=Phyllopteryx taeniolatus TaxID=161469 RepID=UPI002AD5092B|nr:adhesion G-protein coupled receptor G4 [Phyllopteryx taeniolatus]
MNSVTNVSSPNACLLLLVCLLASPSSSSSLWGKMVRFRLPPCVWQLKPGIVVPPLQDLSVCMLLRRAYDTEWTAFVYKAPGSSHVELGLGGTEAQLVVWLFGQEWHLELELKVRKWYSVCLTWSGVANRLRLFLNGTMLSEASLPSTDAHEHLAQNGTLTLGVSHYLDATGAVTVERGNNLLGEISQFRMWAREWSEEELQRRTCADGDVVSWDQRQWKYNCPPETDENLHCAWSFFKIKMQTSFTQTKQTENSSESLMRTTRQWLENIFPLGISVSDVSLDSSASHTSNVQLPQESRAASASTCNKCFSSEVNIMVDPAASVEVVQANVSSWIVSNDALNLMVEPNSIRVVPTVLADVFLRAELKLNFTGSATKPKEIIEQWLKEKLEVNGTALVLNVVVVEGARRSSQGFNVQTRFHEQIKQYTCDFHVQDYSTSHIDEIQYFIYTTLMFNHEYDNESIVIETTDLKLKQIFPRNCLEDLTVTMYGEYIWPETFPQVNQLMACREPSSQRAHRLCELHIENDTTSWAQPDMTRCSPLVSIPDLENVTVSTDNAAEVVDVIQDLVNAAVGNGTQIPPSELNTVVEKLNQVVNVTTVTPALGGNIISIFSDILISTTNVTPVAVSVLTLTDKMGNTMDFPSDSLSLTAPSLALSMIDVDPEGFEGLTFSASSISSIQEPNVFVNQTSGGKPIPEANVTILLPSTLHNFLPPGKRNKTRVQFQFYGTQDLFQDPDTANSHSKLVNSYIVSASINGSHVSDLDDGERVVITLQHRKAKQPNDTVLCVFWDFQANDGRGGWSSVGCETRTLSPYQTSCLCEHLTHFAVLLDVYRAPISEDHILSIISYIGCGISSIFLGITLLTYLGFEKLRRDYPSKILINLSAALLGLSMLFLLDSWLSSFSNYSLCIVTAAALHYFLLASFTWMGLEAVHMYFALVKVFNTYVPAYILKLCAVGWGVPLVIVSLVLAIDKDAYGDTLDTKAAAESHSTYQFCWLQNDVVFYVVVVAFVLLVLLCNTSVFVVVLLQIRQMGANKEPSTRSRSALQDLRAMASLTVLLGLSWLIGFFSFGPGRVAMMYLFTIFNTLQGFLVFLFHCLMKDNVRKQWRLHLGCGDHSDWSTTVGFHARKNYRVNSKTPLRNTSESDTKPQNRKGA